VWQRGEGRGQGCKKSANRPACIRPRYGASLSGGCGVLQSYTGGCCGCDAAGVVKPCGMGADGAALGVGRASHAH
jgi:hypothetical protein